MTLEATETNDELMERMLSFRRSYVVSAILLTILAIAGVAVAIQLERDVAVSVISAPAAAGAFFPIFRQGGIFGNRQMAVGIAVIFTILTGAMVGWCFLDFVNTRGGEGPHGEGSPQANIIAIAFGAAMTFCPWLLTALRGLRAYDRTGQDVT